MFYILLLISAIISRSSSAFSNSRLADAKTIWADKSLTKRLYSSFGIFLRSSLAFLASSGKSGRKPLSMILLILVGVILWSFLSFFWVWRRREFSSSFACMLFVILSAYIRSEGRRVGTAFVR